MKNNRITKKLIIYFSISFIILSLITTVIFIVLSSNNIVDTEKKNMEERAQTMSKSLSSLLENNNDAPVENSDGHSHNAENEYSDYLRFIGDIAMSDVWVVDANKELVSEIKTDHNLYNYSYKEMPKDVVNIIDDVLNDNTSTTEGFSNYLSQPTLSVGAPILNKDDKVIGAVILHKSIDGIEEASKSGIVILLISTLLGFVISLCLAILFSYKFTRPLKELNNNTKKLTHGDYLERNNIKQNDEIGDLGININKLAEYLLKAQENNDALDQMRQTFITNISHELKTPVTVIKSQLEAIDDGTIGNAKQRKIAFNQVYQEAILLDRLIYDLLELSKLQNVEFTIQKTDIIINDIINDVIRSYINTAQEKNINLIFENDEKIITIKGDYQRIRQLLSILIDNAIKFNHEGKSIKIILDEKGLQVINYGDGINEEDLPYIFNRFYYNKTNNNSGNGLGLAIAKEIADKHNFKIDVEQDKSTNFTITF